MSCQVIDADVIVIGMGCAGLRAAIAARRQGKDVLLISKNSGSSAEISAFNVVLKDADSRDSLEAHCRDTIKGGGYINNPTLVGILVNEAESAFRELDEMGIPFEKSDGRIRQRRVSGSSFARTVYCGDILGRQLVSRLRELATSMGVKIWTQCFVTRLVRYGTRVTGALGLDLKKQDLVCFNSNSIVLATGGLGQIYAFTTNSPDITGDGYAMAYRAGAKLIDMEFVQFEPTVAVYPEECRGIVIPTALFGYGAKLRNVKEERFIEQFDAKNMELCSKDLLARAITLEISKDLATSHGGVYLDLSDSKRETIMSGFPTLYERIRIVDPWTIPIEVAPSAHYHMGGVLIDEQCRSSLSGLFAAGEVAGGIHGANRIAGNSCTDILVFGARAGRFAAQTTQRPKCKIEKTEIEAERNRISRFFRKGKDPSKLMKQLQKVMWKNVGMIRNYVGLKMALDTIGDLRREARNATAGNFDELKNVFELFNAMTSSELVVRAALMRKESRGAHFRRDYPKTDGERWLKNIVIQERKGRIFAKTLVLKNRTTR